MRSLIFPTLGYWKVNISHSPINSYRRNDYVKLIISNISFNPFKILRLQTPTKVMLARPWMNHCTRQTKLTISRLYIFQQVRNVLTKKDESDRFQTLSFYRYKNIPEDNLDTIRENLLRIGKDLNVVGRIYISKEGINAQMAISERKLLLWQEHVSKLLKPFGIVPTWNVGISDIFEPSFNTLNVKKKKQLVADDLNASMEQDAKHLPPEEWHNKLSQKNDKTILFDQRNAYESVIGHFEGAITPNVVNFRESMDILIKTLENVEKSNDIFLYCTGGIRCTRSGSIVKDMGFNNVYVLKGGITAYANYIKGEKDKKSLFKGVNFTFDKRTFIKGASERVTNDVIGKCHVCGTPTDSYRNCASLSCNALYLACNRCNEISKHTCGLEECMDTIGVDLRKFGMRNRPVVDKQRGRRL